MHLTKYLAVVFVFALPSLAQAQEIAAPAAGPHLTAQGHAEIKTRADVATLTLTVKAAARLETMAAQENAARTTALIGQIKMLPGMKNADIQTTDYSVGRQFKNADTNPTLVGYAVTNTVRVTLRTVSQTSRLIDIAVSSGATQVSGLNYGLSDRVGAERRALTQAVADARGRAQTMATALGMTLGSLRLLSDNSSSYSFADGNMTGNVVYNGAGLENTISPQQVTIRADVGLDYNLSPQ